jgi:hypothetical protein
MARRHDPVGRSSAPSGSDSNQPSGAHAYGFNRPETAQILKLVQRRPHSEASL